MKIEGQYINDEIKILINNKKSKLSDILVFIEGKIFNKKNLEKEYNIKSSDDIELIKSLYDKDKELNFLNKIDGNYVIVIYDNSLNKMFLIKDKLGYFPMYYYYQDNKLIFSNYLSSIKENVNFKLELNQQAIANYLGYSYVYEPDTIYLNTYKLEKGCYLEFDGNILNVNKYFDICYEARDILRNNKSSEEELVEDIEKLFYKQIEKISDKNAQVGLFMSSGKDSTLLAKLCSNYYKKKINTYTLGFEDEIDESKDAEVFADVINTNHHSIILKNNEVKKIIKKIPLLYDEPFADPSVIPTIYMIEHIKDNNDFYLAGEGVDGLFELFKVNDDKNKWEYFKERLYKITHGIRIAKNIDEEKQIAVIRRFSFSDKLTKLRGKVFKLNDKYNYEKSNLELYGHIGSEKVRNKNISVLRNNNMVYYTPFYNVDILFKFLTLNDEMIYKNKERKYIFNKIVYKNIDKKYYDNYKKKGFGIPLQKWIDNYMLDDIKKLSTKEKIDKQNIFNYKELSKIISNYEKYPTRSRALVVWNYYVFQLWYMHNISKI